ncbi:MAG: GNAT family N-acetyltransferase [Aeromicrobium sp.]
MTSGDVDDVLDVQQPGAVRSLSEVFPQDQYPFPREDVAEQWRREIADPGVSCYVVVADSKIAGFAATRGDEFLHFGIATDRWGSGLATSAHDDVLARLSNEGHERTWLKVFTENRRGRCFYEKLGWRAVGERMRSAFPPHPELLRYERAVRSVESAK